MALFNIHTAKKKIDYRPDFVMREISEDELPNIPWKVRIIYLSLQVKGYIENRDILEDCMKEHPTYFEKNY